MVDEHPRKACQKKSTEENAETDAASDSSLSQDLLPVW